MPGVSPVITSMPTFSGVPFFIMDEMHLIGRGMGCQIYVMLNPTKNLRFRGLLGYSFTLVTGFTGPQIMEMVGRYIRLSKATMPRCFEGSWDAPSGHYRAVDWEDFLSAVVPGIFLQYIADDITKKMVMCLVNGCNRSMKRRITDEDLATIQSRFDTWHAYQTSELQAGRISERVFTPNNHYLTHIPYIIQQMGPLRFVSCRASERNIKTHSCSIRSSSKPSQNVNNNILKREVLQSLGIREILEDDDVPVGDRPDSFRRLPSDDQNGPELWEPAGAFVSLNDGTICLGLQDATIILALQSCYGRLRNEVQSVVLDNTNVTIAKRLWIRHFVITSILYRRHVHQTTRADNFILFDTGIYTG